MRARRVDWGRLLIGAVILHVAWGVARIPGKVFGKRIGHVHRAQEGGMARYHLDNRHRQGADVVEWLLENTPADSVVLWRGDDRGALEFVPPLIRPRLLVRAGAVEPSEVAFLGLPIARGRLPSGAEGAVVVIGHRDRLELSVR